jgi:hypothetical protein
MEKLLDVPLREVRIFRNSMARGTTRALDADGLSVGTDVYLAPGRGNPSIPSGQALLAHELSHVAGSSAGRQELGLREELRAQAIEHTVKSQLGLSTMPQTKPLEPALEHRSQPRNVAGPPTASAQAAPDSRGGFVGGGPSGGVPSGPATVHTAPAGRIPAIADAALSAGSAGPMLRSDASDGRPPDSNEPEKDEPGGVDRIVEAVMRRLRREGSFERERRGSFRSEIGG